MPAIPIIVAIRLMSACLRRATWRALQEPPHPRSGLCHPAHHPARRGGPAAPIARGGRLMPLAIHPPAPAS